MAWKHGVVDAFYFGMCFEPLGDLEAALVVAFHAQREGFESTDDAVGGIRSDNTTDQRALFSERVCHALAAKNRSSHKVVVSAEVFCDGVHNDVRAVLERLDIVRAGERGIDDEARARFFLDGNEALEVDHAVVRVGGQLGEDYFGFWADGCLQGVQIIDWNACAFDTEAMQQICEELACGVGWPVGCGEHSRCGCGGGH